MVVAQTWRELLAALTATSQERQRVIRTLGVTSVTLSRWVSGESRPRPHYLQQLPGLFPEQRMLFQALLQEDFKDIEIGQLDNTNKILTIPPEVYTRVMVAYATTVASLHTWTIGHLILQHALEQLDPDREGILVTVIKCMTPSSGKMVRSLRGDMGRGNPPWQQEWSRAPILLGAESLGGYVTTVGRLAVVEDTDETHISIPTRAHQAIKSAAAAPIQQSGRCAGCLAAYSMQPGYFQASRAALLQQYADLISLAFKQEEFYEADCLALSIMPSQDIQKAAFTNFQERLKQIMGEDAKQQLTFAQAEQQVWQKIEHEFIFSPPD